MDFMFTENIASERMLHYLFESLYAKPVKLFLNFCKLHHFNFASEDAIFPVYSSINGSLPTFFEGNIDFSLVIPSTLPLLYEAYLQSNYTKFGLCFAFSLFDVFLQSLQLKKLKNKEEINLDDEQMSHLPNRCSLTEAPDDVSVDIKVLSYRILPAIR